MRRRRDSLEEPGRFAYEGLDRVLHEKARLSVLTSLVTHNRELLFGDLKQLCGLTDGNLSRHLEVLRQAGVVELWKGFDGRRPQTLCRLTPDGHRRFVEYLQQLAQVVRDALPKATRRAPRSAPPPAGWQPVS